MEKDSRAFIDDRSRRHAKRQRIIETLRSERNLLRERVAEQQTGPHAKRTAELEHEMRSLCELRDIADQAYADKKLSLWQLDGNIRKMEKEIRHLQVSVVGYMIRYKKDHYNVNVFINRKPNAPTAPTTPNCSAPKRPSPSSKINWTL